MTIVVLPEALFATAVALWHETGLTRPWNDPDGDLHRVMNASSSTVLAALDEAGGLLGTAMVGHDGHRGWVYYLAVAPQEQRGVVAFYEALGYADAECLVLGRRLDG